MLKVQTANCLKSLPTAYGTTRSPLTSTRVVSSIQVRTDGCHRCRNLSPHSSYFIVTH